MDKDTRWKKIPFIKLWQALISESLPIDIKVHLVCFPLVHPFVYPDNPPASVWNLCTWREARFQQDHPLDLHYRSPQRMGFSFRTGFAFPRRIPLYLPMGWWPNGSMVNGIYVSPASIIPRWNINSVNCTGFASSSSWLSFTLPWSSLCSTSCPLLPMANFVTESKVFQASSSSRWNICMKSTDQSVAHTVTLISLVSLGLVDQRTFKKYIIHLPLQSKHIVIFDTLIQQSKPEEVEAVLGELLKMIF